MSRVGAVGGHDDKEMDPILCSPRGVSVRHEKEGLTVMFHWKIKEIVSVLWFLKGICTINMMRAQKIPFMSLILPLEFIFENFAP